MAYPTAAELVARSTIDELTSLDDTTKETLWRSSVAAVEEYTNQSFVFTPDTLLEVNGTGTRTLFLPARLETLDSLVVSYSALTASDVILSEKRDSLNVRAEAGIGNYYERTMREFNDNLPLKFTYGVGTVQVSGDWGWSECPQAIGDAILLDMEDQALADANQLSSTLRASRVLGMREISQGNLRAASDFAPGLSNRVQRLLLPYIWIGQVGAVV